MGSVDDFHLLNEYCIEGWPYYEQSDNIGEYDGQAQAQYNSAYNLSLEPDGALDVDLESGTPAGDHTFTNTKRHTMPDYGVSQSFSSTNGSPQLGSNSPKRSETYPSIQEGHNIARNQRLDNIDNILSRIGLGIASTSTQSGSQASGIANVAQSLPVNPIADLGGEEWPVPTFFLDQIDGPTPPLDRADDITLDELENSPQLFANTQSQDLEYTHTNDQQSMAENLDSVPPHIPDYHKVPNSDSGIGSSMMSYRHGPQSTMAPSYQHSQSRRGGKSSTRGSQAKGSVMFDKGSTAGFPNSGLYQQAAAKLGPLTSAASSTARSVATQPMLSETALKTMKTIILEPILDDYKFRDFWHICTMAGQQMDTGQIGSLRDLEKFLYHKASNQKNNQAYNIFCKEFLSHVKQSLKYMPQNELLRSYDRPYDTGYFMDIMAPFNKSTISQEEDDPGFERWLRSTKYQPEKRIAETKIDGGAAKRAKPNQPTVNIHVNDQISFGHDGYNHISMIPGGGSQGYIQTSLVPCIMGPPALPASTFNSSNSAIAVDPARHPRGRGRRRSSGNQQKEPPQYRCDWPDCAHAPFNRACDLTKHEKTHTRPHKCSVAGCRYATQGFPTEKERDRHWTDKHSQEAPSYHCHYHPCTYKSKRDSNCKQHMENTHGYKYVRTKQNYKTHDHKRQSASPTSPTSQGSPTGSSPARKDNPVVKESHTTSHYQQTTDDQSSVMSGFPLEVKELYTMEEVENLKNLLINHNQAAEQHQHLAADTFGQQGFIHSGAVSLPYPDAMDPGYLTYTPMPDGNIDPNLQFMGGEEEFWSGTGTRNAHRDIPMDTGK